MWPLPAAGNSVASTAAAVRAVAGLPLSVINARLEAYVQEHEWDQVQ